MYQDIPADHEIERLGVGKSANRGFLEVDLSKLGYLSAFSSNSKDLRIAINADDGSG